MGLSDEEEKINASPSIHVRFLLNRRAQEGGEVRASALDRFFLLQRSRCPPGVWGLTRSRRLGAHRGMKRDPQPGSRTPPDSPVLAMTSKCISGGHALDPPMYNGGPASWLIP